MNTLRHFAHLLVPGASLLLLLAAGCGAKDSAPAAGTMRVTSVEPVEAPPLPSILQNGDFADWPEGKPCPTNCRQPDPSLSTIERGKTADGGYVLQQVWQKTDAREPMNKRFGIFSDVHPNTLYNVEITASSPEPDKAEVGLCSVDAGGKLKTLSYFLVRLDTGPEAKTFTAKFNTKENTRIFLQSGHFEEVKTPSSIQWYSWKLRPAKE